MACRKLCSGMLLLLAVGWLTIAPRVLGGETPASAPIAAPAASAQLSTGELGVVDVRGPGEWASTGVPRGAAEVSLFARPGTINDNFIDRVLAAVGGDKSTPIATICATGVRSSMASDILRKNGFTEVYDIAEGMFGSKFGPGWLRRGLPLGPCRTC